MINTTALLIPVFLLMVFVEWYISHRRHDNRYTTGNVLMNMAIGSIDQIGSIFFFSVLYLVLNVVYKHYRLFELNNAWYQWVGGYLAVDFLSYWYHRWSHRVNILWAGHVTHHSSELFNLSNGFRTSLFQGANRIVFWSVLPIFGFSPGILILILKISGLYDFLLHTEYVPKLGVLEKILITPSSHRVHHGQNDLYLDKNFGSTFSVWDRLFGTFQDETEPVKYGVKGGYSDRSPVWAIGYYYHYLWKAVLATPAWRDKVKLLVMPPEWKPASFTAPQATLVQGRVQVPKRVRYYVIFQVSCSVVGIILLLVYQHFMSSYGFLACALVGVVTISNHAILFNDTQRRGFKAREVQRLVAQGALVLLAVSVTREPYLLFVLGFLAVSLLLMVGSRVRKAR